MHIGGLKFRSTQDIKKFCAQTLDDAQLGRPLQGSLHPFLDDLVKRHNTQVIEDVDHFEVHILEPRLNRAFVAVQADGTEIPFSYKMCITKRSHRRRVHEAFRLLVRYQIQAFTEKMYEDGKTPLCFFSGAHVPRETAEVHHIEPDTFSNIVEDFAKIHKFSMDDIDVLVPGHFRDEPQIASAQLRDAFCEYHLKHARVVIVSHKAHFEHHANDQF